MFENQVGMSQMLLGQRDDIRHMAERTAEPWRFADSTSPARPKGGRFGGPRGFRGILALVVVSLARPRTRGRPQTLCCSDP